MKYKGEDTLNMLDVKHLPLLQPGSSGRRICIGKKKVNKEGGRGREGDRGHKEGKG